MNVKFHNPELPKDMEVDVGGLCLINGKTVKFTAEELELYEVRHEGQSLKSRLSTNPFAEVDGVAGKVKYLHPENQVEESEATSDEKPKEGDK